MATKTPRLKVVCRDQRAALMTANDLNITNAKFEGDKALVVVGEQALLARFLVEAKSKGQIGGISYATALTELGQHWVEPAGRTIAP